MISPTAVRFVMLALALATGACGDRRSKAASATDTSFAAMQARGETVMGVDQYTSAHVFEDLPDGGRIILDTQAIERPRGAEVRIVTTDPTAGHEAMP